jgi:(p)ppGpp synthase/HD superfamily hydrolase
MTSSALELHADAASEGFERQTIPYVAHLLEVAAVVMSESVPDGVAIAALLHDGPEEASVCQCPTSSVRHSVP